MPNLFMFPVVDDARLRFTGRKFNCLVEQSFVVDDPFVLNAAVGADDHLRLPYKHSPVTPVTRHTSHLTRLVIKTSEEFIRFRT